ncbi:hypothetical protein MNBD_IGNAVI01-599 [hydrothermal vent metagenome]|uniref:Transglutaminase-like domain-containing protein n=1 Tax=hydrothermal vent metagenome TaxID=652676 RepID=A0A3B1C4N0_9ZZZZ
MYLKKLLLILVLFLISVTEIFSQQSLDIFGGFSKLIKPKFRLNSFESNTMNYNKTIDWEFTFSGTVFKTPELMSDIMMASIGKKIGDNYIYARYTPGFRKSFLLHTDTLVTVNDSVNILNSKLNYSEKFGLGYSYQFSDKFSGGISIRYFEQSYAQDNIYFYFSDTINTLVTITDEWQKKHWRADIGFSYQPLDNLLFNISSYNLFIFAESGEFEEHKNLELKVDKGAILGIDYEPINNLYLTGNVETSGSFIAGTNYKLDLFSGKLGLGISLFHDKYQEQFIAGFQPALNYSYRSFNISVSAVLYSDKRDNRMPSTDLLNTGIHNIINNQFSYNSITANFNLALNFKPEQNVKFIDVEITNEIFPTFAEEYLTKQFAVGKVVNISDKSIVVKPSSYIHAVNDEMIYSPSVAIAANDTADVQFFTVISESKSEFKKREISQVDFYLTTTYEEFDDEMQKPILVNDRNSWDSKVKDLRYFVKYDLTNSNRYAKNILSQNRDSLKNVPDVLKDFERIKILFNYFAEQMQYVSDPRASVEYVQFPSQTLELKGGDCDDLSVVFSSILESIGIQTAFVDFISEDGISHVNLLVNTKLKPDQSSLITQNDKKFFLRKNVKGSEEVWIPIEMTSLTDFETSWEIASQKFYSEAIENYGLSKRKVVIFDIY